MSSGSLVNDYQDDFEDPECTHCESMSVRDASPAPSLYSYDSSRDGDMRKELYGRELNTLSEVSHDAISSSFLISQQLYMLPCDEEEFQYDPQRNHLHHSIAFTDIKIACIRCGSYGMTVGFV